MAVISLLLLCLSTASAEELHTHDHQHDPAAEHTHDHQHDEEVPVGHGGEEAEEDDDDEEGYVSTWALFPHHNDSSLPAGERVDVLVGVHNGHQELQLIQAVRAILVSPQDATQSLRNLTSVRVNRTLAPQHALTAHYNFTIPDDVEVPAAILILEVFYTDVSNRTFVKIAYNKTLTIHPARTPWDLRLVFGLLTLLGVAGVSGYALLGGLRPKTRGSSASRSSAASKASPQQRSSASRVEADTSFLTPEARKFLAQKARSSPGRPAAGTPNKAAAASPPAPAPVAPAPQPASPPAAAASTPGKHSGKKGK